MQSMDQFKQTYITECNELLSDMETRLMGLDTEAPSIDELNAIFRCAHSIKGGAGAFGFNEITSFTHILEALLDAMREGKVSVSRTAVDTLLKSVDIVTQMVKAAETGTPVPTGLGSDIAIELQKIAGGGIAVKSAAGEKQKKAEETVFCDIKFIPHDNIFMTGNEPLLILRELHKIGNLKVTINYSRLPNLTDINPETCYLSWELEIESKAGLGPVKEAFEFVETECDLSIETYAGVKDKAVIEEEKAVQHKNADANASANTKAPAGKPDSSAKSAGATSIRVDLDKVDKLVNMVGEVVIIQAMLAAQTRYLPVDQFQELLRGIDELSQHTRELQEAVMSVRMQAVKSIFSRMPRIVRDLSTQLGKDIQLLTSGENTEVDKTVIEQLSDPLTHMIRNSVDHGIEKPEIREQNGKPRQGTIHLTASQRGGRIVIEVIDDGAGINRERVLSKAKEKGLVAADAALTNEEIEQLIFAPGFSTAEVVTNVSGRGVGMDVVKRNIEALGGKVSIASTPGKGSVFTVSLPLTLAILDGMIVRSGKEFYIIPIANIIETMRPTISQIRKVADGNEVINVRGEFIPLTYLGSIFNISNAITDPTKGLIVLLENNKQKLGLVVDELVGQQQVVIKSLEENSDPVDGIGGATILGDGKVSLILDVAKLSNIAASQKISQKAA